MIQITEKWEMDSHSKTDSITIQTIESKTLVMRCKATSYNRVIFQYMIDLHNQYRGNDSIKQDFTNDISKETINVIQSKIVKQSKIEKYVQPVSKKENNGFNFFKFIEKLFS